MASGKYEKWQHLHICSDVESLQGKPDCDLKSLDLCLKY